MKRVLLMLWHELVGHPVSRGEFELTRAEDGEFYPMPICQACGAVNPGNWRKA